uniref:transporter associated domain-containing protein n=1 Tax=Streptomyces exfoliatus TaxID=1905 RepID=UPI00056B55CC
VRLGRAVPHFLPTFYEQAARVFLQHENTTYAAAFFGKAREAERVHALAVDEERQRAVFLEFAFAGALTVKALKEHVRDLSRRLDPAEAWAQFRQLTVERCAAGMPPYASLPQDARGLVRAAGLDRVAEECALVADLLGRIPAPGDRAELPGWRIAVRQVGHYRAERVRFVRLTDLPDTAPHAPAPALLEVAR